jgi:hypothetical protein
MGLFRKAPDHTKDKVRGMGYKTDGRKTHGKISRGKQRMLLDSTKLLLDNDAYDYVNPYDAVKRMDNSVYDMFYQDGGDADE